VAEERRARGEVVEERELSVWTSARRRAYHTAWPFVRLGYKVTEKPQMGEINVRRLSCGGASLMAASWLIDDPCRLPSPASGTA
jgi:hypothetical protein